MAQQGGEMPTQEEKRTNSLQFNPTLATRLTRAETWFNFANSPFLLLNYPCDFRVW